MKANEVGYKKILVATDFSEHARAALQQAVWLARKTGARVVVAHTLPDVRRAVHLASYKARLDLLYGEGSLFQREIRQVTELKMRHLLMELNATDLNIESETLLGEPFVAISHAVHNVGYDLVLAGSRGLAAWEQFFIGSTAKRLIRKCPASVWIVKAEHVGSPHVVLATTDFSEVSLRAVRQALWIADQAKADFHLLHVVDSTDVPDDIVASISDGSTLRDEINSEAQERLEAFVDSLAVDRTKVHLHLEWGTPWSVICKTAQQVGADLIAMGTVGRSGIQGVLLGNTAEKVLGSCDCSILTTKPEDFVSPIAPPSWPTPEEVDRKSVD